MICKATTLAVAIALFASLAQAATPADGDWKTQKDNAVVRISGCGDALCGYLVTSDRLKSHPEQMDVRNRDKSLRSRTLKGMALFSGLKGGPTEWTDGSLYDPEDGKTYKGSIRLVDVDTMKLTGCVFVPLCLSQTWTRIR